MESAAGEAFERCRENLISTFLALLDTDLWHKLDKNGLVSQYKPMLSLTTMMFAQFGSSVSPTVATLVAAVGVGLVGGASSGLLGVSPGGAVVVLSTLLLGADQHLAQGISLAVQIPPTSVSGIRRYRAKGHRCPLRWLTWLAAGMLAGGTVGAIIAAHALLFVGLVAGLSSGFLGIGGGLAIVIGLGTCLKISQHRAQMIGFILTITPITVCVAFWAPC